MHYDEKKSKLYNKNSSICHGCMGQVLVMFQNLTKFVISVSDGDICLGKQCPEGKYCQEDNKIETGYRCCRNKKCGEYVNYTNKHDVWTCLMRSSLSSLYMSNCLSPSTEEIKCGEFLDLRKRYLIKSVLTYYLTLLLILMFCFGSKTSPHDALLQEYRISITLLKIYYVFHYL